jgi:hypothetical protein
MSHQRRLWRRLRSRKSVDLTLSRGVQRAVRVVDERGLALANAALFTACDGHVKSTSVTGAEGRGSVALPGSGSGAVYAIPKKARSASHVSTDLTASSSAFPRDLRH